MEGAWGGRKRTGFSYIVWPKITCSKDAEFKKEFFFFFFYCVYWGKGELL